MIYFHDLFFTIVSSSLTKPRSNKMDQNGLPDRPDPMDYLMFSPVFLLVFTMFSWVTRCDQPRRSPGASLVHWAAAGKVPRKRLKEPKLMWKKPWGNPGCGTWNLQMVDVFMDVPHRTVNVFIKTRVTCKWFIVSIEVYILNLFAFPLSLIWNKRKVYLHILGEQV